MHLFGIFFCLALLVLLGKALVETAFGLFLIFAGLLIWAIGWSLKGLLWIRRAFSTLWRTAFD